MKEKTLEQLFGSAVKARILKVFFYNSHLSFSLEDLAKKSQLSLKEAKREIDKLLKLGILKSHDFKKKTKKKK